MLTLSPPADLAARIHDLGIVSARTAARRARLLAMAPAADVWAGPSATAFIHGRLITATASLASLAEGLHAIAGLLGGLPTYYLPEVDASSPTTLVMQVQRELGVPADGVWGPVTSLSARRFQLSTGLPMDGVVDAATALVLAAHAVGGAVRLGSPALESLSGATLGAVPLSGALAGPPVGPPVGPPIRQPIDPEPAPSPADGGTADGGTADGGTADGGTADGGTADGGTDSPGPGAPDPPESLAPLLAPVTAAAPVPYIGATSDDGYDTGDPDSDPGPDDPEPADLP